MNMFKPTSATSPEDYIAQIDEPRRSDIQTLHDLIRQEVPQLEPFMLYGMIGYGPHHYKYASGREGDWSRLALASQKNYISLYVTCTNEEGYVAEAYKEKLPKANIGKSCIRFKRLADVDLVVLRELFRKTAALTEV
jgi:hypothetical protein